MGERKDIAIVGSGKVGTALGVLARRAGWRVVVVAGREASSAAAAAGAADLVLLTVPDGAIAVVCDELAGAGAFRSGAVVAHCSGALASDVLASARETCGCAVGSMHPLQAFPSAEAAVATLGGAFFFCEGDDAAVSVLERLAESIGGRAVRIAPGAKALYHAAAAMACNHLTALLDAAAAMCEQAGIDRATAMEALGPMVRATIENVASMGPEAALTGPVARGDVETVRRHLAALADCPPALRGFYRAAATWTARLAEGKGAAGPAAIMEIRRLLADTEGGA